LPAKEKINPLPMGINLDENFLERKAPPCGFIRSHPYGEPLSNMQADEIDKMMQNKISDWVVHESHSLDARLQWIAEMK